MSVEKMQLKVELNFTKLLGFKSVASASQDGERLNRALDDTFNKVSELPPAHA